MRCSEDGHAVCYQSETSSGCGLLKPLEKEDSGAWADLHIVDSNRFAKEADSLRNEGRKVLGPSRWSAMLDLDVNYSKQMIAALGFSLNGIQHGTHLYISAWFNGATFIASYTSVLYRRFMPGGAGPDLNCTGMLGCFQDVTPKTYQAFLAPLEKTLKKVNHRGPVHIHALVQGDSFCVKELSASFMHPLSLLLYENTNLSTSELLLRLLDETSKPIQTTDAWTSGVQLSVPPFPYTRSANQTVLEGIIPANLKHIWLADVSFKEGYFISDYGLVGYVTARGKDENECVRRMYRTVGNLKAQDMQFRNDVGRNTQSLLQSLRQPGWIC